MKPGEFVLHGHFESGNVYKPALLFALTRTPFRYRHVEIFKGEARSPEYVAEFNRFHEVPVLEHRGENVVQSSVILTYLADVLGAFGGESPAEKRRVAEWLVWDNHRLTMGISGLRFQRRFVKAPDAGVLKFLEARSTDALDLVDRELKDRPFLVGARPTIADISCAGYLFWTDQLGVELGMWPHVQRWLERIAALPGYRAPYDLLPRETCDVPSASETR